MPKVPNAYSLPTSRYRTLGLVGRGQFGRVFCARSRKTGEIFALKELDQHRFPTSKFLRELRFLLTLQHPNIVSCYAIEHSRGNRYLVMEYCEAGTLRDLLNHSGGLTPLQGLKLIIDTLQGLAHAHQSNIIHCDLKPENVLLKLTSKGWQAKVSDFGVAKLAQEIDNEGNNNTGSPGYMAPERFYGQFSIASDLYAIGVMLYEVLLGKRPFSGNPAELMRAHINQRVQIPDTLPIALRDVVAKSLEKLPRKRFNSALAMKEAIVAALKSDQVSKANLSQVLAFAAIDQLDVEVLPANYPAPIDLDKLDKQDQQKERQGDRVFKRDLPAHVTELVVLGTTPKPILPNPNEHDLPITVASVAICGVVDGQLRLEQVELNGDPNAGIAGIKVAIASLANQLRDRSLAPSLTFEQAIENLSIWGDRLFIFTGDSVYGLPANPESTSRKSQLLHRAAELQPNQPCLKAVSPRADWVALAQGSRLELKNLSNDRAFSLNFAKATANVQISAITAFDRHHLVVLLQQDNCEFSQIALVSRRGNLLWRYPLPNRISAAVANCTNGRLILLEAKTNHLGLVELFPYRVNRLRLDYAPMAIAPTDWGCIIATDLGNGQSNLNLLDLSGHRVGRLTVRGQVLKISLLNMHTLLVLTNANEANQADPNNTERTDPSDRSDPLEQRDRHSSVYLIDLKQLEVDIIF
ncbi:serine/threonine protein kinase [Thalassoporum mexicanum PCC 7367]|uniref:serine/threonine-protein kinase n=1 Tax=Thalassoporum mexicanum TaxID=3457544 RepID=UPI00029FC140|nr:serine/threonine-protein kinase [Pseudanabaena sp. PCC 7367]AFY71321.1 serine/threonine protein kinase [Pseudanabaena sp. PCC 7367]